MHVGNSIGNTAVLYHGKGPETQLNRVVWKMLCTRHPALNNASQHKPLIFHQKQYNEDHDYFQC